jgi:acetyltransferase-like isoleucine patch superfamily enzyme
MSYLSTEQVAALGFRSVGKNVLISEKASIYNPAVITIRDNCRIDDFCLLSGKLEIGSRTHLAPYSMLAGGEAGILIGSYVTFAYGAKVFSESDDYSGNSLVGSLVPRGLKLYLEKQHISIGNFCIVGTNSTIMPPASLEEGVAVGAHSFVKSRLPAWGIYCGIPATWLKARSSGIKSDFLNLEF